MSIVQEVKSQGLWVNSLRQAQKIAMAPVDQSPAVYSADLINPLFSCGSRLTAAGQPEARFSILLSAPLMQHQW